MTKSILVIITFLGVFDLYAKERPVQVTLDCFFNYESRKMPERGVERFHYIWEETDPQGFSLFESMFTQLGAKLSSLEVAPTKKNLKNTDIFILVDPDNLKDNPMPNSIEKSHAEAVKKLDFERRCAGFNGKRQRQLRFVRIEYAGQYVGIKFTNLSRNMVQGNEFATGAVLLSEENEIFKQAKKAYLKEVSILEIAQPVKAVISKNNEISMAVSRYGKGAVFAVGDPWLYNEYVDGTKIPAEYENFMAGTELAKWLVNLVKHEL